MTTHRNNFAGQTIGADVTVANSGDSGSAFTQVSPGSGTIKYASDPAGGGRVAVALTPASSTNCFVRDVSYNSVQISISDCFYYSGAPTSDTIVHQVAADAGWVANTAIHQDGNIRLVPQGGSTVYGPAPLTAGHWYRIETQVMSDASAGSIACQWYIDDGATQTGQVSIPSTGTRGGAITTIYRGLPSNAASPYPVWYYSNIQAQDGTLTPLGPYPQASPGGMYLRWGGQWVQVTVGA